MSITARVIDSDLTTSLGALEDMHMPTWIDSRAADMGSAEVSVPHDSPSLVATPTLLQPDNVIILAVDGTDRFGFLVRGRSRMAQVGTWDAVTVTGPGLLELLRTALVYQWGGLDAPFSTDERIFSWTAPDFVDDPATTDWIEGDSLHSLGQVIDADLDNLTDVPDDWPDPYAEWLWTRAPTGDPATHPAGTCYFRRTIQPGPDEEGRVRIHVTAANSYTAYFDGVQIAQGDYYRSFQTADVDLIDGVDHVLAFSVENQDPGTFTGQNIGALLVTITQLDEDDEPSDVIYRTFTPATSGGSESPGPWRGLDYPASVPGVTPGFILKTLFDEAQARGWLSAVSIDFDADVDSDGDAWTQEIEFSCMVGNDSIASVIERLHDLGIDCRMSTGFVFSAYDDLGDDLTGTVELPPDEVQELMMETEDEIIDTLLVRTRSSWSELPDPSPSDRREGFLSLGLTPSRETGESIGEDTLDDFASARVMVRCTIRASQGLPEPYADFGVGDTIDAPYLDPDQIGGSWSADAMRVDGIGAGMDEDGDVRWMLELSPGEVAG